MNDETKFPQVHAVSSVPSTGRGESGGNADPEMLGMGSLPANNPWYAVQTKVHHELQVATALQSKGYETFVPFYQTKRRWSDRNKSVSVPLFPTYTFCRSDRGIGYRIVSTPGVTRIVAFGAGPAPIDPEEIDSLKIALKSGAPCVPHPMIPAGQKVRIVEGPLAGVTGIFVAGAKKGRVVMSVSLVQTAASVEVDEDFVIPDTPRCVP